ncbi:hypothetical protein M0812_23640 [Anaeramoeba flamelloides]|uniref:Uncharacterized protein n=1 Tax=Anaeramoeba flamelloides TaxID=1746091 RepID=A0AAV7YT86_9EUKA|nr:hypothetical protein M0812_23640 [Anaeramoeba flamelloides]
MDQPIISPKMEIKKDTPFRDAGSFRERLEFLIKWYPQDIHGLELKHLENLSSQPNESNLAKPSLVRIKRDCLNDLVKILEKPKKSLQRGLATFFRSSFGLYNVSNYNREWLVFGKKPKNETNKKKKIRKKTSRFVKKKTTKTQRKTKTKTQLPTTWPKIETKQLTKKQIVTKRQQTQRQKSMSYNNDNEKIRKSNPKINIGIQQKEKHQQYFRYNNRTRLDNKMINNMKGRENKIKNEKTNDNNSMIHNLNNNANTNIEINTNININTKIKTNTNNDGNFNNVFENKLQLTKEPNINLRKRLFINVESSINYRQFQNFEQKNQQKKRNLITKIIKHQQKLSKEKIQEQEQEQQPQQIKEKIQEKEQEQKQIQKQEENLAKFTISRPKLSPQNNQQPHFQSGNWKDFKNKVNLNNLQHQQNHPFKFEDQFNIQLNKPFENNIKNENGLKDSCEGLFMVRDPFSFEEDSQFVLLQNQPEMDNFHEFL